MKRITAVLFFLCTLVHSQEMTIQKNGLYVNYHYEFEKLDNDEILSFSWHHFSINGEKYTFQLFAQNIKTGEKRLLGNWDIGWAQYQFAENKKTAVFFFQARGYNRPLFYIDGRLGLIKYLMDINLSARTNFNMDYILATDNYPADILKLYLIEIKTERIVSTIEWKITRINVGNWTQIYRSLDKNYDYRIDFGSEDQLIASCYYKINENRVYQIFDYSGLPFEYYLENRVINFVELGID
jgi:hypothetical protein